MARRDSTANQRRGFWVGSWTGRSAAWLVAAALGSAAGSPGVAYAGPAEESKALNNKGAALFKRGEYFEAAQAFERAYALDARDFRVLRYAGRSWQEIGHWERALTLLERYYGLETEAELRASLLPNLEKLRKTTPRERAEALEKAATRYPQARLEEEAARALQALGDAASLRRAVQLLEVARLGAASAAEKDRLDKEIAQARDTALKAEQREAAQRLASQSAQPALVLPKAAEPPGSSGASGLQWGLWGGGGALALGGATLWLVGRSQTFEAADRLAVLPSEKAEERRAARSDYDQGSLLYFAGIGATALGVGAVAAGFLLGPSAGKVAVLPARNYVSVAVRF